MPVSIYRGSLLLLLISLVGLQLRAQSTPPASAPTQGSSQPEGWEHAGYTVHQSIEIGYRVSDVTGSELMYDTLVNLHTGPRLLSQTLSMQSENHDGVLFDNLFLDSFGWGGDVNNALRARLDKNKWYDFRAAFRRDQNVFNYDLLANPLNPASSSPSLPINYSPHNFTTTRRMSDFDLTLLPQSIISFKLGYSHNNMTGPSYSSVHEGTDALLLQDWNTTLNSYRFGADFKFLPRTVFSYDQFLDYYKGDTNWQLAPSNPAQLPGGQGTVELGLPIDTTNKTPCAVNSPATSLIDSNGILTNLVCSSFFGYNRSNRVRTSMPTERVGLHSTYFKRLEFAASYAYSTADMNAPFNEFFNGFSSRSGLRQSTVVNTPGLPTEATRISNVAEFVVTGHLTEHIRLVDTFRLWDYRIPEAGNFTETDWTPPTTGTGACAPPITVLTPVSCAVASSSTSTDNRSFNQDLKRNQTELIWDINKHLGARVGFRYGDQTFTHILDFTTGDEDIFHVHEYTALFGFWAKPMTNLRFNFDWEHTNRDDVIVRIGARKEARYRIQSTYTPRQWAVIGGSINLWDSSNGDALTDYRGHNRNYGFTASLNPRERVSLELAYNFDDYRQDAFVCFNDSNTSLPVVANAGSCTANGYNDDNNNTLLTYGNYTSRTHYGMASILFRPAHRVTTQVGYSVTSVDGETPQFNILQPFGSLQYTYHQPLANLGVDIGHNLTARAGWNYHQYGENSFVGPTAPRYFHANNTTFSLLWAF